MNKFKVSNLPVHNTPSNQFANKLNLTEPELIPISWFTRLFGCWHKKMGIPFTRRNQTYNSCMICGACQKFDVKLWKNTGPFYYIPVPALYDSHAEKTYISNKVVSSFEINRWVEDGGQN